ncbi:hypothetical protein TPB0596_44350 [Tsukamurella pulmonis]|uniref:Asp23 family, cell envelope-related function n=1 Tax=Tsukamurella pulmonis TaxID=47312 RepID=A0A1H1B110_9ACTN|nr:hypothetical protein [Tsukamurella pulmonis]KXO94194.1 hypothetical protein AXK56_21695 [Tsukamurella pulmonis]KXP08107.1 hypothetical protein AXK57_16650 [Tsukamurella pulmonis]RDH11013.1 hypothetical protein DVB88_15215 [Tsukamurella pulmonis]SDQ45604.1 hypothetical protein SAMN04489765_0483 [Tsukamurella pulmonis]SUP25799.1 Uncharacterised protein [Tsukamurella pulmonis]
MSRAHAARVDGVVAAVTAVDGVVGVHAGGPGAPATYLPGRTVRGVRLDDEGGQVAVVLEFRRDIDLIDLADRVRAVATDAAGVPVDVVVSDIAVSGNPDAASSKEFSA